MGGSVKPDCHGVTHVRVGPLKLTEQERKEKITCLQWTGSLPEALGSAQCEELGVTCMDQLCAKGLVVVQGRDTPKDKEREVNTAEPPAKPKLLLLLLVLCIYLLSFLYPIFLFLILILIFNLLNLSLF